MSLKDMICVNIRTKDDESVRPLGSKVYDFLKGLETHGINKVYFTHYNYNPPSVKHPHVRVGIRLPELSLEDETRQFIDDFVSQNIDLIEKDYKTEIEHPQGNNETTYPDGVVSDYVICDCFSFVIEFKELQNLQEYLIVEWFLKNKEKLFHEIVEKYEKLVGRSFNNEDTFKILERATHHIMNSFFIPTNQIHEITKILYQHDFFIK